MAKGQLNTVQPVKRWTIGWSPLLVNERYIQFVEDRLLNGSVGFFDPIKKLKLNTGLSEKVKQPKVLIVKEDCQASGEHLSKSSKIGDALQYPLALVPSSIAASDRTLRPSQKHLLRTYIVTQSEATTKECPQNARWLIDGVAVMRSSKPNMTFCDLFSLLA